LTCIVNQYTINIKVILNRYHLKKRVIFSGEEMMRKLVFFVGLVFLAVFSPPSVVKAHFQGLIPSDDMVTKSDRKTISLDIAFFHPFEGLYMDMAKPVAFGVMVRGRKTNLLETLREKKIGGFSAWHADYRVRAPGDHIFYLEPRPYWEPSEDCFIIHYTKVVINSLGVEGSWDEEIGLKTEIIPLTRPYGLWRGNVFQGIVKVNGKPAPGTEVEVEYYNRNGKIEAPADPMVTQVTKAALTVVFNFPLVRVEGGEKKLVSLATVLVMKPEVLLLDEPTSGLDEETTERIIQVLNHSSTSYMIISQDRGLLARTTRCIYRMVNGKLEQVKEF
jgi:cobalt/nickel transport protein